MNWNCYPLGLNSNNTVGEVPVGMAPCDPMRNVRVKLMPQLGGIKILHYMKMLKWFALGGYHNN